MFELRWGAGRPSLVGTALAKPEPVRDRYGSKRRIKIIELPWATPKRANPNRDKWFRIKKSTLDLDASVFRNRARNMLSIISARRAKISIT